MALNSTSNGPQPNVKFVLKNGKYADYEVVVKGKEKYVARWHSIIIQIGENNWDLET